jgi:LmbE family N-acetylglucosaminyl deacetylase
MNKVLVIAAHPDDDVLGCGGTLAKMTLAGCNVRVVFIAEGTTCRFQSGHPIKEINNEISKREKYAKLALSILGVNDVCFHNLPCGKLDQFPILEINKIIEKEIKLFSPDTILTHSSVDANSDHRRVNESIIMATRPGALNLVESILCFEVLSSTEWKFSNSFTPNYFVSLGKNEAEKKVKSMKAYESEVGDFPFPRSEKGIMSMLRVRGMQSGSEYAEAFEILRIIKR